VFRDGNQIGALTNLCAHQNGPLGEGRIINGCVHLPLATATNIGWEDGCAPAPFTEKLATYRLRLRERRRRGQPEGAAARDTRGDPNCLRIAAFRGLPAV